MTRRRFTNAEIERLDEQILAVLEDDNPQSVRHIFYMMTDPRLPVPVDKSEAGYGRVQRRCLELRRAGRIPFAWISDATRQGHHVPAYDNAGEFLEAFAGLYRTQLWTAEMPHVEVWCESRSIWSTSSGATNTPSNSTRGDRRWRRPGRKRSNSRLSTGRAQHIAAIATETKAGRKAASALFRRGRNARSRQGIVMAQRVGADSPTSRRLYDHAVASRPDIQQHKIAEAHTDDPQFRVGKSGSLRPDDTRPHEYDCSRPQAHRQSGRYEGDSGRGVCRREPIIAAKYQTPGGSGEGGEAAQDRAKHSTRSLEVAYAGRRQAAFREKDHGRTHCAYRHVPERASLYNVDFSSYRTRGYWRISERGIGGLGEIHSG